MPAPSRNAPLLISSVEPDLFPYSAVATIPAQSVLVLAPHPDDEIFGCGGAIAAHVSLRIPVKVVVLTDGAGAGIPTQRALESQQAAKVLGYGVPEFWDAPDRALLCNELLLQRLIRALQQSRVDLIYAPSPWEIHPDHRQSCALAMQAVVRAGTPTRLAFYEVGAPLRPNVLLDISSHIHVKHKAMACFSTQLQRQDYIRHITALNIYRTYTLAPSVQAAEAYWLVSADALASGSVAAQLHHIVPGQISVPRASSADCPLVSVLIRSMDRDHLARALDSIALQTYSRIEIVVIAARPGHRELPKHCGPFPLMLHTTTETLLRSRAANKALDMAHGELLLLLDDDDWLMPEHIARLAHVLALQPQTGAAYTGVALVDAEALPRGQVFDIPFDTTRQLTGNLMPIHAVLFRRQLVSDGCRFDETLDLYEDWDFWLQVTRRTMMAHLPGVSAVYQVHDSSGVHEQSGPRQSKTQAIYQKWSPRWEEHEWASLMERNWAFPDLENSLKCSEQHAAQCIAVAQTASADAAAMAAQLESLRSSSSWRFTAPLRWIGGKFRRTFQVTRRIRAILADEGFAGLRYRAEQRWRNLTSPPLTYPQWIALQTTTNTTGEPNLRNETQHWKHHPVLSIVMPVFNPPLDLLFAAVQSIQQQTYGHWELCMADDASTAPGVWECLQDFAQQDPRIKITRRQKNGHISQASNTALELASGDFMVLMDNDDLLPRDALHWVVDAINQRPSVQILYTDEDKLDSDGQRFGPYFKPDWNHTLFLGHNMISHLGVYRMDLVRTVGGFRQGFEGSQDYDLALRCIEKTAPDDIVHIAKVLYHWRAIEGSTALAVQAKPYALLAAQQALTEHLQRTGRSGEIQIAEHANYRWKRSPPGNCRISVINVGLSNPTISPGECEDNVAHLHCAIVDITVCAPTGEDLCKALNQCQGDLIAIFRSGLQPDHTDALIELASWAVDPDVGMVAGTVRNGSGLLISGGLILNNTSVCATLLKGLPRQSIGYMGRGALPQELSAVSMDCVIIRKEIVARLGGPLAQLGLGDLAATEWCLRLREQGLKIVWCPQASWTQHSTRYRDKPNRDARIYFDAHVRPRYQRWLSHDPAYHVAFNTLPADFTLRKPLA